MERDLLSIPVGLLAPLLVGGTIAVSIACLRLSRGFVRSEFSEGHNDVAGFIYAVVGLMYGVLVAFIVVAVYQQFAAAQASVGSEASELRALYTETQYLPQPLREEARRQIPVYIRAVVDYDWPAMASGGESEQARDALDNLRGIYHHLNAANPAQRLALTDSTNHLDVISTDRTDRILASQEGLNGLLWASLLFGGAVVILFSFIFYVPNVRTQMVMTALLAGTIAFFLFMIASMDYPFTGDIHVTSRALVYALHHLND